VNAGARRVVWRIDVVGPNVDITAAPMSDMDTDAALLEAVRGGDERAFERLVLRYKDRIYNYVLRMVRRREPAEDLTQEVFVRVFLAARTVRRHRSFAAWLYRVANNICVDEHRRRKHEKALVGSLDAPVRTETGEVTAEVPDDTRNPERLAGKRELGRAVWDAIEELPPKMRSVVLLFDMEGLSYEEIAEAVGCPVGTVKSRLFNARAQLRERLREYVVGSSETSGQ
jgi:RNA polymerase sigma-70 factor (ECF subfamily)